MSWLPLLLLACSLSGPAKPDDSVRKVQAETAVWELFRSIDAGDCSGITAVMPKAKTKEQCDELVSEAREQGLTLEGVDEVVVDGRDPDAFLVKTRVTKGGEIAKVIVRATWSAEGWSIRM